MFIVVVGRSVPATNSGISAGKPTLVNRLTGATNSSTVQLYGQFELDQAKMLAEAGHKVILVGLDLRSVRRWRRWGMVETELEFSRDPGQKAPEGNTKITAINISWPLGAVGAKLTYAMLGKAWQRVYRAILAKYGTPDIIHAHFVKIAAPIVLAAANPAGSPQNSALEKPGENSHKNLVGKLITKIRKLAQKPAADLPARPECPIVITEHSSAFALGKTSQFELEAAEKSYRMADQVIAVSQSLADLLAQKFAIEAKVVPNVVDVATYTARELPDGCNKHLISVGSLVEVKRMDLLISAFLRANIPDAKLTIVGGGPKMADLKQLAGQDSRITLTGALPRAEIADRMAASAGFISTSSYETFGVAMVEALAAGLPVLATKSGGAQSFINGKVGQLVASEISVEDLAGQLKIFSEKLSRFDRSQIRQYAVTNFGPAAVSEKLTYLYRQIVETSGQE